MNNSTQQAATKLLKPIVANPFAQYRLICFPCAGGNASMFQSWPAHIQQNIEILALHAPGRGARFFDPPFESMDDLVDNLLPEADVLNEKPYVIFGHSLGARVGYEFVRRATSLGHPSPLHFIASGSRAPNVPCFSSETYTLPSEAFLKLILEMDGIPEEIRSSDEMLSLLEPTFRADFKIAETYLGRVQQMTCPISALCGQDDGRVAKAEVMQWQAFSDLPLMIKTFAGGHFFINHNVDALHDISGILNNAFAVTSNKVFREAG